MKSEKVRYIDTNRIFYHEGTVQATTPRMVDLDMVVGYESYYDETLGISRPYTVVHLLHSYFLDPLILIDMSYDEFKEKFNKYRDMLSSETGLINRANNEN